jgi:SpoIID/LytB domain protein
MVFQLQNSQMKVISQQPATACDEEVAAIACAIQLLLLEEEKLAGKDTPPALPSNWLTVRARSFVGYAKKPWGLRYLSLLFVGLLSVSDSCAQAQTALKSKQSATADLGGLLGYSGPAVRVLLGQSLATFNLDCPDGAVLYTLEGNFPPVKVGQIAPQGSFRLSLAAASSRLPRSNSLQLAFKPVNLQSKLELADAISKVAFFPAAALPTAVPKLTALPWVSEPQGATSYLLVPGCEKTYLGNGPSNQFQARPSTQAASVFAVNDKLYRGALLIKPQVKPQVKTQVLNPVVFPATVAATSVSSTTFNLVNILCLEDYLLSVVPSEVPSKWHSEALKAQAIAARSYALANLNKHGNEGYDLKATVEDQVYRGVVSETEETNAAVQTTEGVVIKHENKVVSAFFHSTSGGVTEVSENVWGKPLPYLKVVHDYDDASPQFNWTKKLTVEDVTRVLDPKFALNSERLLGLFVISRYSGRRVKDVLLAGEKSSRIFSAGELRKAFNLPSTAFSIFQSEGGYSIAGRGYGHGLGLSQWGAKALAESGYNASQILSYYYKDISIESNQDFAL